MTAPALPMSPKQVASVVEALEPAPPGETKVAIWCGAIRAGKTTASIVAFFIAVQQAPPTGLILICGRTLQTIERNIIEPMQDEKVYGPLADAVQHTRGSSTATVLGRTVHLIGAADARAEGKLRGLTACLAMVDEATLMPQEFWTQLIGRLSVEGARLLATTNPGSKNHWLKTEYIDRAEEMKYGFWNFTMDDNPILKPEWIAQQKKTFSGIFYARNVLGHWLGAEGGIYDMFDPDKHVIPRAELPDMKSILGVGIDYGTTNATASVMLGLGVDDCLYVVDEWYKKAGDNEARWSDAQLSQGVKTWLGSEHLPNQDIPVGPLIVDPAAASFRVQLKQDGLKSYAAKNDVINGIRTVASLFATDKLKISDHCYRLLDELPEYCWDPAATERGEDKPIKQNDHACLVAGTMIATEHGDMPIENVTVGTRVWTRQGLRPVIAAGMTSESAQVKTVTFSNAATLTGTGNHPVWADGDFVPIDWLRYGFIVNTWTSESKSPCSTESSSAATRTLRSSRISATTPRESQTGSAALSASMKKYGCTPTAFGPSQWITTSTTSTTTTATTTQAISNSSTGTTTIDTTRKSGRTILNGLSGRVNGWITRGLLRANGTALRQGVSGIASMVSALQRTVSLQNSHASSAVPSTRQRTVATVPGFAPTSASLHGGEHLVSTMSTGRAKDVTTHSGSTGTASSDTAPVSVVSVVEQRHAQPVYNLTIAEVPEYYASGVLVHNCDALRYSVATTERKWRRHIGGERVMSAEEPQEFDPVLTKRTT